MATAVDLPQQNTTALIQRSTCSGRCPDQARSWLREGAAEAGAEGIAAIGEARSFRNETLARFAK